MQRERIVWGLRKGGSGGVAAPDRGHWAGMPKAAIPLKKGDRQLSAEDLERFETDLELALYREYRDVLPMFRYVVETARRFYLCNGYHLEQHEAGGDTWFELTLNDAWVWDVYRPTRFVSQVSVRTFRDVNIEELKHSDRRDPLEALND